MSLAYFRMFLHEFLNKDPEIIPEEAPLIILDSKYPVCMAKNGKDTNNKSHISRRVNFVWNGEKCKTHKIEWCEIGLQLVDIATKNVDENDLNSRTKYITVRLEN